jgi:hypothetical protein
MQTFLPYPDFQKSAQCLDYKRLGKQRCEAWQIYQILKRQKERENYMEITLSNGLKTKVNTEDYNKYKNFSWTFCGSGMPSVKGWYKGKKEYLHRLITNCPKEYVVDHINRDTLDNRKCNLRICTHKDNMRNRISKTGTSKYKGVNWDKNRKKWAVYIRYNNRTYNLGRYENEKEAGRVYDKKAKEFFGEFAKLNFPKRNGYENHPIVKRWKNFEVALLCYGIAICDEWRKRGYIDNLGIKFLLELRQRFGQKEQLIIPKWLGNEQFHSSHRSNLLRKNPEWYGKFGWKEPNNLPYIWG